MRIPEPLADWWLEAADYPPEVAHNNTHMRQKEKSVGAAYYFGSWFLATSRTS